MFKTVRFRVSWLQAEGAGFKFEGLGVFVIGFRGLGFGFRG